MPTLLVVVVEVGAASYLAPVLQLWCESPPSFGWRVAATKPAASILGKAVPDSRFSTCDLDRDAAALPRFADTTHILSSIAAWPLEFAAMRAGLPSLHLIDTWYGYRRRLTERETLRLPERLIVIDEQAREEAVGEGLPRERLCLGGHPALAEIAILPPLAGRDTLFIGQPVARDYGSSLGYTERESWEILHEAARRRPDLFGDIRYAPHPAETPPRSLSSEQLIRFDAAQLKGTFSQIIGMFSTPLTEAFLAGRRVASIQPGAVGFDMCALSRLGLITRIETADALIAALEAPMPDPSPLRASLSSSVERCSTEIERFIHEH